MYATLYHFLKRFLRDRTIFKYGFNLSPMYRRSSGKIQYVSDDLLKVRIKIPISLKNRNYAGSIFGGSLFSATDPIFMIQLIYKLGDDYIVWDKKSTIHFKRPAFETAFVDFIFTQDEIDTIKKRIQVENKLDLVKELKITNKDASIVFAEVSKTIYIADKKYYKSKRRH